MQEIQYIGTKDFSAEERVTVQQISEEQYAKIKRLHKHIDGMTVHIKSTEKPGAKKRYDIHTRLAVIGKEHIESCASSDYDLRLALHKSFEDIEHQVEHKLHLN
ncbi:MAG: hypothetical protein Q7K43_02600 [Candidatus Woesearchaeota archaeon]|nr:hypothetical protein [Candidatus Woesearchaeota archaeon]